MIRILHVVSSLGVGSGIMSCLMNYHRHINRQDINFDYLSFRETDNTYEKEIEALGGRIYRCKKPALSQDFFQELDAFFTAHQGEYEIVHCHPIYCTAFFASLAKRHGVSHVIQHSHTTKFSDKTKSAVRNAVINTVFGRCATDYAACSEEAKSLFWWKKKAEVRLIPNAVDYGRFAYSEEKRRALRDAFGIPQDAFVIGHVGRFCEAKNHTFMLKVFSEYHHTHPHARLFLVGDGPLEGQIRQQIAGLSCEQNIIFAGRHANVEDFYNVMDVFLFPSVFEGLGIALLEAQASGLPCITSNQVPSTADVTGTVRFLSLQAGESVWSYEIEKISLSDRTLPRRIETLNIQPEARALEAYYTELLL